MLDVNTIYTGDCRELERLIPDACARLVLCDPVYNAIWQYEWVSHFAGRVLMDGGSLIAETGHIYRFDAECACQDERLTKRPLLMEVFTGGFRSIWMHHALRASNPFIWMEKGYNKERGWLATAAFGAKDKSRHRWGDGERYFAYLLERLTKPGELVIDPFCGSGTVPAVCTKMDRPWIAFEIDPDTANFARERLAHIQPMMNGFNDLWQQAKLQESQP